MSETKHSPEPWAVVECGHWGGVNDARGCAVAGDENRRRIVACVNSLAGIPTAALEAGALAKALEAMELVGYCDPVRMGLPASTYRATIRRQAEHARAALRALGRLAP